MTMLKTGSARQILAGVVGCLGCLATGSVIGYTSPALPLLELEDPELYTVSVQSWIGSFNPLGALVGSFLAGFIIDAIGRRATLMFVSAPGFLTGWMLVGFSVHLAMMYTGRFIGGFCVGLTLATNSMYILETSESKIRGMTGSFPQLFIVIGILYAYAVGAFVDWNVLAYICAALIAPFFCCLFLVPETPKYLIMKGKDEQAKKSLMWLRPTDFEEIDKEISAIKFNILEDQQKKASWSEFKKPRAWKAFMISMALMLFQQTSGVNAVIYYTVDIFAEAGKDIDPNLSTCIVGIVQVAATLACSLLADRLGRRILLLSSTSLMMISSAIIGAFFFIKEKNSEDAANIGWLPLVCLVLFIIGFSIGIGPLPWLITTEIVPSEARSIAVSIANAFNWTMVFVVTISFEPLKDAIGSFGVFWMFAGFCAIATTFIAILTPETKGKSLEEIEAFFIKK